MSEFDIEAEREHFAQVARDTFAELKAVTAERDDYIARLAAAETAREQMLAEAWERGHFYCAAEQGDVRCINPYATTDAGRDVDATVGIRPACPTCEGSSRETVDMVCPTCGFDYGTVTSGDCHPPDEQRSGE